MSLDKSLMVVCGGEVVVVATCNAAIVDDVAAVVGVADADDVLFGVGVVAVVIVWVQRC